MLIMAMVGGGTWAFFNDIQTSANNLLTAGTMNLGLGNSTNPGGGSVNATWTSPAGWKPSQNVTANMSVKNVGNIDMSSVNVSFAWTYNEGTPHTVYGWQNTTGTDNLTDTVIASVATWNGTGSFVPCSFQGDCLQVLSGNGSMNLGSLSAGKEASLNLTWLFSNNATNGCQGDTANVTLTLTATQ